MNRKQKTQDKRILIIADNRELVASLKRYFDFVLGLMVNHFGFNETDKLAKDKGKADCILVDFTQDNGNTDAFIFIGRNDTILSRFMLKICLTYNASQLSDERGALLKKCSWKFLDLLKINESWRTLHK